MTKAGLQMLENESCVPTNIIMDIIVHRIANEIFKLAAEGVFSRYICDVNTEDALQMTGRLMKMFPDCSYTIQGNVSKDLSSLEINWS